MNRILIFTIIAFSAAMANVEKEAIVKRGCAKFGMEMFNNLCDQTEENVVFSPFSAHAVLSMVYGGAGGTTKEAFSSTLHTPDPETAAEGYQEVLNELNNETDDVQISVANKVYVNPEHELKPEYSDLCKQRYFSEIETVNFSKQSEAANEINTWVEEKTNDKIKNLVSPNDLSVDTHVVLVNAMYFKAPWDLPFDRRETQNAAFSVTQEKTVDVPMMNTAGMFNYKKDEELGMEIVEMPFKNKQFSMFVMLPTKKCAVDELQRKLRTVEKKQITKGMTNTYMDLSIPKFKVEQSVDMEQYLKKMGLGEIFDSGKCDLTNMFKNQEDIYISKALQKTYLQVNEAGCEAASASAVVGVGRALPQASFCANHPFLMSVIHKDPETENNILLAGRIVNPSEH